MRRLIATFGLLATLVPLQAIAKTDKPNILLIMSDDVGITNISAYGEGLVGGSELGIADNTIVVYTCDNGPHYNGWLDGGISPFRGEKNTNWEGGFRVPGMVRWPGKIKSEHVSNEIMSHLDWVL